jgi:hypothetical protein
MALGWTQPLTEMSTRNLLGGKGRPAREADNLTAVCELSRKCGSLYVSQLYGPSWPLTRISYLELLIYAMKRQNGGTYCEMKIHNICS